MPRVVIDPERCKGCVLCVEVCPQKMLRPSSIINKKGVHPIEPENSSRCTGCKLCTIICPDVAITIYKNNGAME